jgi:hypothetical protein
MIDSYTTDIIRIVDVSQDKYGAGTDTESADINARVEDTNELIRDFNGKEVMPKMLIIFDYDNDIEPFWKIKVRKKNGVDFQQPDKLWEIQKIESLGMFSKTHYEIWIGTRG